MAGLRTIIVLSFILAIGFLMGILSCALWNNYLPLLTLLTFLLTPLPNWICGKLANQYDFLYDTSYSAGVGSTSDLLDSSGNGIVDFGYFFTGFLFASGIALPTIFHHIGLITIGATLMSILGGILIYATIIIFVVFFRQDRDF